MGTAASFIGSGGAVVDDPKAMPPSSNEAGYDYDTHAWNNRNVQNYRTPMGTWEDSAVRQANIVITMSRSQVQRMVRPPLPQLSPKRVQHTPAPSIYDILDQPATYEDRRSFYSGGPAGYTGSTRNADGIF